mgnify:CR=1 FL=1
MFRLTYYSLLIFVGVITLLVLVSLSVIWKFGNDLPDFRYLQSYKTKAMSRIYSNQDNIIVNSGADLLPFMFKSKGLKNF